jgi:hypothetical protein
MVTSVEAYLAGMCDHGTNGNSNNDSNSNSSAALRSEEESLSSALENMKV